MYRYDGIYKVIKYYPEAGISGFTVWRFVLRRDDPTPAPWTAQGKKRITQLGLEIIVSINVIQVLYINISIDIILCAFSILKTIFFQRLRPLVRQNQSLSLKIKEHYKMQTLKIMNSQRRIHWKELITKNVPKRR